MADKNKADEYYSRPEKLGAWAGFSQFMWNSGTGQFMGRTGSSWAKILLFYLIFYAVLAAFFMALWGLFALTLTDQHPKYQKEESIIGNNPGLGFRPMPPESNVESTLIWFEKQNETNSKTWEDGIKDFLKEFEPNNETTQVDCTKYPPVYPDSCKIDLKAFDPCTAEKGFGYKIGKPCIFLKLNKIYNWTPNYYKKGDTLPAKMPINLKTLINNTAAADEKKLEVVWVSCEGENPADIENLGRAISYKSMGKVQGFLGTYFPFLSSKGYLQPIVAVQFESITPGVLINIECKAWAKNIKHDRQDRRGSVHFELMIDEPTKKN